MKEIRIFEGEKHLSKSYEKVEDAIYKKENTYVISMCFQQEPALGEGDKADSISQYPLEDVLDHFCVYISDFYEDLNTPESDICYLEFAGLDIEDVRNLKGIEGKHIYNKSECDGDKTFIRLIIE